jgi:hypothetical protein
MASRSDRWLEHPVSELVLLAVTKMLSGVCIGGIPPGGGAWVRPVKEFGVILPGDIRYPADHVDPGVGPPACLRGDRAHAPEGAWMSPFDVVDLGLLRARPSPPHVEDWTCHFVRPRPRLLRRLDEAGRRALLEAALDPATQSAWEARRASLAVFKPETVTAYFSLDAYSSKYEARLEWPGGGRPGGHPVTDLRWRALGRRLLPPEGGELCLSRAALRERIGCGEIYLALGLSRAFQGEYWPIVVGVHCLPDYAVALDPASL